MPAVMLASLFILKKRKEARSNASLSLYNKNKVKRRVRSLICFALRFRVLHPHPYGMEPPSCMFNHKRTVPLCSLHIDEIPLFIYKPVWINLL